MSIQGSQHYIRVGSRMHFKRQSVGSKIFPLIDMGTIETANPSFEPTTVELKDGWGGTLKTVDESVTEISENYEITCSNLNQTNMALMFMAGDPSALTQASTPVTGVAQGTHPVDGLVQLVNGSGDPVFQLASIQELRDTSGPTTLVAGEDYVIYDANLGIIKLLSGGATNSLTGNVTLEADYTLTEISGNRVLLPQTLATIKGEAAVYWAADDFEHIWMRKALVSITPSTPALGVEDYSNFSMNVKVLSNPSSAQPAGTLTKIKGELPPLV